MHVKKQVIMFVDPVTLFSITINKWFVVTIIYSAMFAKGILQW